MFRKIAFSLFFCAAIISLGCSNESNSAQDNPPCEEGDSQCEGTSQQNCVPEECTFPAHSVAKCVDDACDFDCEEGYEKDGNSCAAVNSGPVCGDHKCEGDETCTSCEQDCGKCEAEPSCGDHKCEGDETCETCEQDCGKCEAKPSCGDQECNGDETCETCEQDCGKCAAEPSCGDQQCNGDETCETCEQDCGKCEIKPSCGDKQCNGDETCETCEQDCGKCDPCGNHTCDADETYASCKADCMSKHPCANGCPAKMAFLYVGVNSKDDTTHKYKYYNDLTVEEIDAFGLTDFVITTAYSYRTDDDTDKLSKERIQVSKKYVDMILNSTNGENKHVWITVPAWKIPSCKDVSNNMKTFYDKVTTDTKKYIDDLRAALGEDIWNNHVKGIYIPYESVVFSDCMKFDTSNLYSNNHLKMFKDISDYVRTAKTADGKTWKAKSMLWSPYMVKNDNYWYGAEYKCRFNTAMGYAINKTDIFDLVVIQPGHYFSVIYQEKLSSGETKVIQKKDGQTANMHAIKQSIVGQAFVYPEIDGCDKTKCAACSAGKVVGDTKTSKTKIGVQMEIDWEFTDTKSTNYKKKQDLYQQTVDCFNNKTDIISGYDKNKYTFSYYWGAKGSTFSQLQAKVREFYGVEPF